MESLLFVAVSYLLGGIIAILLLEIFTGRVRKRIVGVSYDTQTVTGGGRWIAIIVTILALWVFWPFAIYAALFQRRGRNGS